MSPNAPLSLNPKLFLSTHGLQKGKISPILEQFKPKISWQNASKILDIGCGPGDITVNDLFSQATEHAEMTGIDISPSMVALANETYNNPRLKFILGDIVDPKFGDNYKEYFDLVLSFYCLHHIQDQRQAMKSIHHVLKPGGEILFTILIDSPFHHLNQIMKKKEKWAPYMQYQQEITSPYDNVENPELQVKNLLLDTGFHVENCFLSILPITMPSQEIFFNFIQSINPYLSQIPESLHEEYLEECRRELFSNTKIVRVSDTTGEVSYSYTNIVAFAKKYIFHEEI